MPDKCPGCSKLIADDDILDKIVGHDRYQYVSCERLNIGVVPVARGMSLSMSIS